MKHTFLTITKSLLLVWLLLSSCKKDDIVTTPVNPGNGRETVRPVGQPVGESHSEFVGPDGGLVQSSDGRVKINIPAGALTAETEIGIQPLKNTALNGVGYSYRLTPHGTAFKKKVTVTFSYKNDTRRLSSEKAIEVAFQNDKGVWTCIGGAVNDPVKKTISVQTDHFSDWSFVESMQLSPVVKTIGLNESLTLKALRYVYPVDEKDFVVPLGSPQAGTGEPIALDPKYIVRWTLNGPGRLEGKGSEAVYTAPSAKPANKTATVTVHLNVNGSQVLLISTIQIIDEGIDISVDGGPWKMYPGMANHLPDLKQYSMGNLRTESDMPVFVSFWPKRGTKSDGIYTWSQFSDEDNHVAFQYTTGDLKTIYASMYEDQNHEGKDSGGFIQVEELEKDGKKYITGMFVIDNAGIYEVATAEQKGIGSIMGTFKIQRNW